MAAINFPESPNENDVFTSGRLSWTWTGVYWKVNTLTTSRGSGGGGGYYQSGGNGGTGRDGIVIFAYTTAYGLATATGSYTQTTIGSTDSLGMGAYNYVYTFTGNGTIVFN
jgi:hypothetical protein